MKLYGLPGACSLADHIVLEWTGAPYEMRVLTHDEAKSPEYLAVNPRGQVPALVGSDGWTLTENVAILNYLADRFPAAELGGDGSARGRAEVNRWLAFLNSEVHGGFKPVFAPQRFIADESQHARVQQTALERLRPLFQQLDAQLEGREWLTGQRSIADPYLFVVLRWAHAKQADLSGCTQLESFFARMQGDAGVQAALLAEGQ